MLREKLKLAKKEEEKKDINSKKQQAHLIDLEQKVRELQGNSNNTGTKVEVVSERRLTRVPYVSKDKRKNGSLQKRLLDNKERVNSEDNMDEDNEVIGQSFYLKNLI